jgi:hypothetical protein
MVLFNANEVSPLIYPFSCKKINKNITIAKKWPRVIWDSQELNRRIKITKEKLTSFSAQKTRHKQCPIGWVKHPSWCQFHFICNYANLKLSPLFFLRCRWSSKHTIVTKLRNKIEFNNKTNAYTVQIKVYTDSTKNDK